MFALGEKCGNISYLYTWGTTPVNRGALLDGLKKSGSFGHPAGRDVLGRARSRPGEANDEPAEPILPQPAVPR
jgi:hypothetical protein